MACNHPKLTPEQSAVVLEFWSMHLTDLREDSDTKHETLFEALVIHAAIREAANVTPKTRKPRKAKVHDMIAEGGQRA